MRTNQMHIIQNVQYGQRDNRAISVNITHMPNNAPVQYVVRILEGEL